MEQAQFATPDAGAAPDHGITHSNIVPRMDLDFGLDGDIPKYWFGGDAFKSRFFDAMSTLFPEGERFFINCVRDFRDQVTDPAMQRDVADFIRQEAQHGKVHTQFNDRLQAQGVRVDRIEEHSRGIFKFLRTYTSRKWTLAQTAAVEHLTAIMAHSFFGRAELMADADRRIHAMYVWHGVEEIEHKAVAFDVMQKVARVGWLMRVSAMLYVSLLFPLHVFSIMRHMLIVDGFSFGQRARLFLRGFAWLYGPKGLYLPLMGHYFAYYRPGFHPWQEGEMHIYQQWRSTFERTGDPIAASSQLLAAA